MASVAEQLQRAREAQNLTVYQVAEITKIKTDHIRALEAGQWDAFSAPVYIRGFVRTYAKTLKLDVTQVTADLEGELSQDKKYREPPPLTNDPKGVVDFLMLQLSKMNWRLAVVVLAGVCVVALGTVSLRTWKSRSPADPLQQLGPGLYTPRSEPGGELLPLPAPPARRS